MRPLLTSKVASLTLLALCVAASVLVAACIGGESVSRSEVLESLVPTVVIPAHVKVADSLRSLNDEAESYCADSSTAELTDLRDAWRSARSAVSRARAVRFGPAADRHSPAIIDWHALDSDRIDAILSSGQTLSAQYVREFMPATTRGLRAIEYLLFDGPPLDAPRCNYITATIEAAADEAQAIVEEWTGTGSSSGNVAYADVFTGKASSALLPLSAVSEVVRTSIFLLRTTVDMQLGEALGLDQSTTDVTVLAEGSSGNGVADLKDVVLGMNAVYHGTVPGAPREVSDAGQPRGISDLVSGVSTDADSRVGGAFDAAIESIDALAATGESLSWLVANDPSSVMPVYSALEHLQITLNTEVVSLLGISVGFADTDGDGG